TEGWAAGLQLAILSLRGQADVAGFLEEFSGSHRYVLDYLTEEVLDRQPDQVRNFLLEASVLERLSGELCDAVPGRADGRGGGPYHQLFADLLRARLEREQPERLLGLHQAAAAWYEQHGLVDD